MHPLTVCVSLVSVAHLAVSTAMLRAEPPSQTVQRTERFDTEPGWEGFHNVVELKPIPVVQDFGYSETNHAGGKAKGEMGGRMQRSSTSAYYGKRLAGPRTLNEKFHCSGRFAVTQTDGSSSLYFGWFNTETLAIRPRNWMGFALNGERGGCEVHVAYNTNGGVSDGIRVTGIGPKGAKVRDFNQIPVDTPYTWDFSYDPDANGGNGEFTFTLGGKGPYTGGPFVFKLPPEHRRSGATFNAFGIVNTQAAGRALTAYFDDLEIDGEMESFDRDPDWLASNNRSKFDDYGVEGAQRFGFSDTALAGGKPGELGGRIAPSTPGSYADKVGALTLDHRLVASGKVALAQYGSDGTFYIGWFDSQKRGYPIASVLGVIIDGPSSTGPRVRGCVAANDPKLAEVRGDTGTLIPPDGAKHTWKIEYVPDGAEGRGQMTVWLDDRRDTFALPEGARKAGASFDRFGLFVHGALGGRWSHVYVDDLEYTAAAKP